MAINPEMIGRNHLLDWSTLRSTFLSPNMFLFSPEYLQPKMWEEISRLFLLWSGRDEKIGKHNPRDLYRIGGNGFPNLFVPKLPKYAVS